MLTRAAISLEQASLQALTPDQLLGYVHSVSGARSQLLGEHILHMQGEHAILVGYTPQYAHDTNSLEDAVKALSSIKDTEDIQRISVLAPVRPVCAPTHATHTEDFYYILPFPFTLRQHSNVHAMYKRAQEHIYITQQGNEDTHSADAVWTSAHQELMLHYIRRPDVSKEMSAIFQRLGMYCRVPQVRLFSAYDHISGELLGYTVGDFSSWQTAFYMFALRKNTAPPGVAEALLYALIQEAEKRGYTSCNLGLGINDGIRFFKEKWGAKPTLPLIHTSWEVEAIEQSSRGATGAGSWLRRLFS